MKTLKDTDLILVKSDSLPPIFLKVLEAKKLLENGIVSNVSAATSKIGISRSAFYKYKDSVFFYNKQESEKTVNISALLTDRAGVFSALTARLYQNGVNILTINQNLPVDGTAAVTLSVRTDALTLSLENLLKELEKIDGVISVKII